VEIQLNGEKTTVQEKITVVELIEHLGLSGRRVAIECNSEIIPRDRHAQHQLATGDRVEVVQFVGGG